MTAFMGYEKIYVYHEMILTGTLSYHVQFDTVDRGGIICPASPDHEGVYKCQKHTNPCMYNLC